MLGLLDCFPLPPAHTVVAARKRVKRCIMGARACFLVILQETSEFDEDKWGRRGGGEARAVTLMHRAGP